MAESEELKSLKYTAENEKGKAQSKIYELRNKITQIEKEISHYEGEKEMAEYILGKIMACVGNVKVMIGSNDIKEEKDVN